MSGSASLQDRRTVDAPLRYFSNRGSRLFARALNPLGFAEFSVADTSLDLLYFDSYGGQQAPLCASLGFSLIDRQRSMALDNKASLARGLMEAGIQYPAVCFRLEDVPGPADALWFLKDPRASGGKGIRVLPRAQLTEHFQEGYLIQEAVTDLALHLQRKFTLRLYVLAFRGQVYLFESGFLVLHGAPYRSDSIDPLVQYDHQGYMQDDSPVELLLLDEYPHREQGWHACATTLAACFLAFSTRLKHEPSDRYCLFGVDMLLRQDRSSVLVEVNDRPNLVHTRRINDAVNVPMLRALASVLFEDRVAEHNKRRFPEAAAFVPIVEL